MGVLTKLTIGLVAAIKISLLLYFNFNYEIGLFSHLVIIPVFILEAIGVYGYMTEFPAIKQSQPKAQVYSLETLQLSAQTKSKTACGFRLL